MSVCPVCNYFNNSEAEECKNCYWSIQIDTNEAGLNVNNLIQKKWLTKLIGKLNDKRNIIKSLKAEKTYPLANDNFINKLHKIEIQQKQDNKEITKEIKSLKEQVTELKSLLNSKNNNSDVEIKIMDNLAFHEDTSTSSVIENSFDDFDIRNISTMESSDNNSIFSIESDHNVNNDPNSINEPQDGSLYEVNAHKFLKTIDTQENTEPEINSNNSYENFYCLIEKRQLTYTEASVTKESMEKLRGGTLSELKFSNYYRGNYWIVNWEETYCLIPNKQTINPYQYGNFQRIFECTNYYEDYSKFKLIEPATVIKSDNETWQLERKGKIKFI